VGTSKTQCNSSAFNDSSLPYIHKVFLRYSEFEGVIWCRFDTSRQTDHLSYATCNEGVPRRPKMHIKHFKSLWSLYVPPVLKFTNSTFCPRQCIYVFCVDLRNNSDYFPIQHKMIGFCKRDGMCLLRGKKWILK